MSVAHWATVILLAFTATAAISSHSCTKDLLPSTTGDDDPLAGIPFASLLEEESSFWNTTFGRRPALVQKGMHDFMSLISLTDIFAYLRDQQQKMVGDETRPGFVHHGKDWRLVKRAFRDGEWWSASPKTGPIHIGIVLDMFTKKGFTFVMDRAQEFHPPLKALTSAMEKILGHRVNANVYATPDGGSRNQGFESHFDYMDGLVLQVTGCKQWILARERSSKFPIADTVFRVGRESMADTRELVLRTGSLLYIPRGFAHEAAVNCTNGNVHKMEDKKADDVSIHVTLGLEVAADSTMEIFIHHLIDVLVPMMPPPPESCSNSNSNSSDINSSQDSSDLDSSLCSSSDSSSETEQATFMSTDNELLHAMGLSLRDWLHILVHIAACMDDSRVQPWLSPLDGSPLRTAVATTTFAASFRAYPALADMLPSVVEYLETFGAAAWTPALHTYLARELLLHSSSYLSNDSVSYRRFLSSASDQPQRTVAFTLSSADSPMPTPLSGTSLQEVISSRTWSSTASEAMSTLLPVMWATMVSSLRSDEEQRGSTPLCSAWRKMMLTLSNSRASRV